MNSIKLTQLLLVLSFTVCRSESDFIIDDIATTVVNETAFRPVADTTIDKTDSTSSNSTDLPVNGSTEQKTQQQTDDNNNVAASQSSTAETNDPFETYFSEFLANNPNVTVIRSPKEMENTNKTWNITVEGGTGIEVIVHLLDINPFCNYLFIRAGFEETDNGQYVNITGPVAQTNVQKIKLMDTNELYIFFQFANSEIRKYQGFVLTYKPFGGVNDNNAINPINNATNTVNEEIPRLKILLEVEELNQTQEIWTKFRTMLSNSANKLIASEKIPVEQCRPENVTFIDIMHCPTEWPRSSNCVQMTLSILLDTIHAEDAPSTENNTLSRENTTLLATTETGDNLNAEFIERELSVTHLQQMWLAYARHEFAENGIKEYIAPNTEILLLLWISISLGIISAFLLILYGIWKIDFLRDYRRMTWKGGDDHNQICKQSDIDISMFPSPHQIVPTLFPHDAPAYGAPNPAAACLPYEFVNQPISFNQNDFQRCTSEFQSLELDDSPQDVPEPGIISFQSDIIDFNEPQYRRSEEEVTFRMAEPAAREHIVKYRGNGENE